MRSMSYVYSVCDSFSKENVYRRKLIWFDVCKKFFKNSERNLLERKYFWKNFSNNHHVKILSLPNKNASKRLCNKISLTTCCKCKINYLNNNASHCHDVHMQKKGEQDTREKKWMNEWRRKQGYEVTSTL